MNGTKMLCRVFDKYENGYVTVGDVLKRMPSFLGCIAIIGYYIYGLYAWMYIGLDQVRKYEGISQVFTGFAMSTSFILTLAFIASIAIVSIIYIYTEIEDIKIVSCKKDK